MHCGWLACFRLTFKVLVHGPIACFQAYALLLCGWHVHDPEDELDASSTKTHTRELELTCMIPLLCVSRSASVVEGIMLAKRRVHCKVKGHVQVMSASGSQDSYNETRQQGIYESGRVE